MSTSPETPNAAYSATDPAQLKTYVDTLLGYLGARDPLELMAEMPAALTQAVAGLSSEQAAQPEKPGKWSVRHVVQHLADSELVGGFRFRMILAHETPPIPGYDQDLWADRLAYEGSSLAAALEDFAALRRVNLRVLRRATPADLERCGVHSERGRESLLHLVRLYAGHDVAHLRQIERIRRAIA